VETARRAAGDRAGAGPATPSEAPAAETTVAGALAAGDPRIRPFFAGDPHLRADRLAAAERAAAHPRDRNGLADILAEQNTTWAAPAPALAGAVDDAVDSLRRQDSVAVVTGQQLGLFGGPLYTIHKALTAVQYARRLAEESGRPAVPVFWLADEDHDFAEVSWAAFAAGGDLVRLRYDDGQPADANRGPVGRIILGDGILATLDALARRLPEGPHSAALVEAMRATWRPGARWRDAFAATLRLLLPDAPLVFASADDERMKALAAPVLLGEATDWIATHAAHAARTELVETAGFPAQVPPRRVHLFLLEDGKRLALDPVDPSDPRAGVTVRAGGRRVSASDLALIGRESPALLSPDVVMRPVMQDALLPTAAYVAGPGELAYFAQLGGVYDRFGVPMPIVALRASFTLVEPSIRRVLDVLGVGFAELAGDPVALQTDIALRDGAPALGDSLREADAKVEDALAGARAAVEALDRSLGTAAGAALARSRHALATLRLKAERVARRRADDSAARVARVLAALRPAGAPQERVLSALGLYARYGHRLGTHVGQAIDLEARGHLVTDLP